MPGLQLLLPLSSSPKILHNLPPLSHHIFVSKSWRENFLFDMSLINTTSFILSKDLFLICYPPPKVPIWSLTP